MLILKFIDRKLCFFFFFRFKLICVVLHRCRCRTVRLSVHDYLSEFAHTTLHSDNKAQLSLLVIDIFISKSDRKKKSITLTVWLIICERIIDVEHNISERSFRNSLEMQRFICMLRCAFLMHPTNVTQNIEWTLI